MSFFKNYLSLVPGILIMFSLTACNRHNETLQRIDEYSFNPKQAEVVNRMVDSLFAHSSPSEEEAGQLLLSKTKAQFFMAYSNANFPKGLDSTITTAVNLLEKHDSKKLVDAYYWQGMVFNLGYGKPVEAMVALEKARLILPDDDSEFEARLYQQLGSVYELLGNLDMAINYMHRVVALMNQRKDDVGCIVSNYNIYTLYRQDGQNDSADYYMQKVIRDRVKFKDNRFDLFNEGVGKYYFEHHDLKRAKYYFENTPLADGRLPEALLGLARIARMESRGQDALRYLQRSKVLADSLFLDGKSYRAIMPQYLNSLARYYSDSGDEEKELATRRRADSLEVVVRRQNTQQLNRAVVMEREYLVQQLELQHRKQSRTTLALIAVVVLATATFVFSMARKYIRASRQRLGRMQQKTYRQAHEIGKLKGQMKEISQNQIDKVVEGKSAFEVIAAGSTTMKGWSKAELDKYIAYARFVDSDYFAELDERLAAKPTIFFYLNKKGYSDSEIAHIMGVSNGSIRTMRYNIRKQVKDSGVN